MTRKLGLSVGLGVIALGFLFVLALFAGLTPPTFVQWFQTRSQAARYDNYPTLDGSEHIGTERYLTSPDTLGPRVGQLRRIYSIPEGTTAADAFAQLQTLIPDGYVQLGDAHCTDLIANRPAGPLGSTDTRGQAGRLVRAETEFTVLESGGGTGDGITFRLGSYRGEQVISADQVRFACESVQE